MNRNHPIIQSSNESSNSGVGGRHVKWAHGKVKADKEVLMWDTTTELFLAGCHSCCKFKWLQKATGWINWQKIHSSYWMQILHLLMLSQRWLEAGRALWGRLVFAYLVIIMTTRSDHIWNQTNLWSQPVQTPYLTVYGMKWKIALFFTCSVNLKLLLVWGWALKKYIGKEYEKFLRISCLLVCKCHLLYLYSYNSHEKGAFMW